MVGFGFQGIRMLALAWFSDVGFRGI